MLKNSTGKQCGILLLGSVIISLLVSCSNRYPTACPNENLIGLVDAERFANEEDLPFRFPLDASKMIETPFFGLFGISNECTPEIKDCYNFPERQYHAAEDYKQPAGTPVYAIADGWISFSGRMGGYGWLIIVDHPSVNIYSLYGHLSPSRWKLQTGTVVSKGDIIAYLGDPDENGGSAKSPLEPHLHFGIRTGQRHDYPGRGEWRFQAGWIRNCPQNLGWVHPSGVISSQVIPEGGFIAPEPGFFIRWGLELIIVGCYSLFGVGLIFSAIRKKARLFVLVSGLIVTTAGIVLFRNGMLSTYILLWIGILLFLCGMYYAVLMRDLWSR